MTQIVSTHDIVINEPGALKAHFSTEGTLRMKEYARENDIPLEEFGVVVVAQSDAEEARLETLQDQADANGAETELLREQTAIEEHEPHTTGQAAPSAARPPGWPADIGTQPTDSDEVTDD